MRKQNTSLTRLLRSRQAEQELFGKLLKAFEQDENITTIGALARAADTSAFKARKLLGDRKVLDGITKRMDVRIHREDRKR